jgi:hypothetical protein
MCVWIGYELALESNETYGANRYGRVLNVKLLDVLGERFGKFNLPFID